MRVFINGEERELEEGIDLNSLIQDLILDPKMIVVEVNGNIINRKDIAEYQIKNMDRIEMIRFMAGG